MASLLTALLAQRVPYARSRTGTFLVVSTITILSCDSGTEPQAAGQPASMEIVAGHDQEGVVGQELPAPLVVRVEDANGQPVPNQFVNWVVASGGGHVFAGGGPTNTEGIAQEYWTLGPSTNVEHRLEVRAVDPTTGERLVFARFTARPRADVPAAIAKVGTDVEAAPASQPVSPSPTVLVTDKYGNPVPGATVTFAVTGGGGSVNPASAVTNASGQATTAWTLGSQPGANTVRASLGELAAVSFSTIGVIGEVSKLAIVREPSADAQSGVPLAEQPVVRLTDAHGNPVRKSGVQVSAAIESGVGTLGGTLTALTNADGLATFANLAITGNAPSYSLKFSASGLLSVVSREIAMQVNSGTVTALRFTTPPSASTQSGQPLAQQPVVQLIDADGAPVREAGVAITASLNPTDGILGGSRSVATDAEGIARFTDLSISGHGWSYTLAFAAPGLLPATAPVQMRKSGYLTIEKISGDDQRAAPGAALGAPIVVRLVGENGTPVANQTVSAWVQSGGGKATPVEATTSSDGTAVFTWTLGAAEGQQQLTIWKSNVYPAHFFATASLDAVSPVTVTKWFGDAAGRPIRSQHEVGVLVVDQNGDPLPNTVVDYDIVGGGGTLSSSQSVTDATGRTRFAGWTLGPEPGTNQLRARVGSESSVVFAVTTLPYITVTIEQPTYFVYGTTPIQAAVTSARALQSVRATLDTLSTDLTLNTSTGKWTGTIYNHIPRGEHELIVVATDVEGESVEARRTVRHDYLPVLEVESPLNDAAAIPSLRLKARCIDDTGCVSIGGTYGTSVQGSELDQTVSLASNAGRTVKVTISATDEAGQKAYHESLVHVENVPGLQKVYEVGGRLFDVNETHAVYGVGKTNGRYEVWWLDRASRASVKVMDDYYYTNWHEFADVTATGFTLLHNYKVLEYRNGTLSELGSFNSAAFPIVRDGWALWLSGTTLSRRNLETGQTVIIPGNVEKMGDVAPNGVVAYVSAGQAFRYGNGTATQLSTRSDATHSWPTTDGTNVAYGRATAAGFELVLHSGTGEVVLSTLASNPVSLPPVLADNGWVAYFRQATSSSLDLVMRSPEGVETRVWSGTNMPYLRAVLPDGTLVISEGVGLRDAISPSVPDVRTPLARHSLTQLRWIDGRLHMMLGTSLMTYQR